MKEYIIKNKAIPLDDSWDVIVAGGGPAGCAAAIAASREGARTLLIEGTGCLGGMGTSGMVPAWCPFSDQEQIIYRSIALQIFEASKKCLPHVPKDAVDWVPIQAEHLKRIYDEAVSGSGASVLFHTFLCGVEANGQSEVERIIVSNKEGLTAFQAKLYIDCTGDGDLACWAGAQVMMSDPAELQPATHCFSLGNIDEYAYKYGPRMHGSHAESPIHDILKDGSFPLITDTHICNNIVSPGEVGFNAGHLWELDSTRPESVSAAMMTGRKMAFAYRDALAKHHPKAFANAVVTQTAPLMGIRESRRIVGDYVLKVEDYVNRQDFPDEIGRSSYYIDVHYSAKELAAGNIRRPEKYGRGDSFGIPYRCLTPRGLKNVLVAGRCISSDQMMQGSVRVMPVCLVTGEAAGTAAVMALPGRDVHQVEPDRLRETLKRYGAFFH